MSKSNEFISLLMDNELPSEKGGKIIDQMASGSSLRDTWARYHIIRDALTQDLPEHLSIDLSHIISNESEQAK